MADRDTTALLDNLAAIQRHIVQLSSATNLEIARLTDELKADPTYQRLLKEREALEKKARDEVMLLENGTGNEIVRIDYVAAREKVNVERLKKYAKAHNLPELQEFIEPGEPSTKVSYLVK